ncbi:MAG: hypothetical protein KAR40_06185 [Candidatus Sabulitectum sp.]|nr:hypothetical protein [Candidatus Sabulitectum sp.]
MNTDIIVKTIAVLDRNKMTESQIISWLKSRYALADAVINSIISDVKECVALRETI